MKATTPLCFVCVVAMITVNCGEWYRIWQEFVSVKDIELISDMTVTSCQSRCMVTPTCENVGLLEEPLLGDIRECYLLTKGWHNRSMLKVGGNHESVMLYVLETVCYFCHG